MENDRLRIVREGLERIRRNFVEDQHEYTVAEIDSHTQRPLNRYLPEGEGQEIVLWEFPNGQT